MRPLILASSFLFLVLTSCSDKKEVALEKCSDKQTRLNYLQQLRTEVSGLEDRRNFWIKSNFVYTVDNLFLTPNPERVIIPNKLTNQTKEDYEKNKWEDLNKQNLKIKKVGDEIKLQEQSIDKKFGKDNLQSKLKDSDYYRNFQDCEKEYIQSPTAFINKWK